MSDFDTNTTPSLRLWKKEDSQPNRRERELDQLAGVGPRRTRTIPLKVLVQLLMDAQKRNSAWLTDFSDDPVVIDADLHDVLLAYQQHRHKRAA